MSITELEVKFAADDMVGRLARFLRMLGFDTFYHPHINDNQLIDKALKEKRIILTRDTRLIEKELVREYILIKSDNPKDQLFRVLDEFGLKPRKDAMLTRCLECNQILNDIAKEEIRDKVWPYVYDHHGDFRICPGCQRIYWRGDHVRAMTARFELMGIFENGD